MKKISSFFKREAVLCVSAVLALGSMLIEPPSAKYLGYIDVRTLAVLFCLMAVTGGLSLLGVFDRAAGALASGARSTRAMVAALVLLCFFLSMFVTNDVALITFVPLSLMILRKCSLERLMIRVTVLQTIAANLGSILTPIGNPQNLYLYNLSGMSLGQFILLMLPYAALSFALLIAGCVLCTPRSREGDPIESFRMEPVSGAVSKGRLVMHCALFILSLLTVMQLLPWPALLAAVMLCCLLFDRRAMLKVDYSLLLTFVFFFIFIGNLGGIPEVSAFIRETVEGREVLVGIIASQLISNVPAAILLSGYTSNIGGLLIGVDIGGLGTLIASMASLISYRFYVRERDSRSGRYLLVFTLWNLAFLAANCLLYMVIGR